MMITESEAILEAVLDTLDSEQKQKLANFAANRISDERALFGLPLTQSQVQDFLHKLHGAILSHSAEQSHSFYQRGQT